MELEINKGCLREEAQKATELNQQNHEIYTIPFRKASRRCPTITLGLTL